MNHLLAQEVAMVRQISLAGLSEQPTHAGDLELQIEECIE